MKKRLWLSVLFFLMICALYLPQRSAGSGSAQIYPAYYPRIADKEMGQLRYVLSIADQDMDDFSRMEALDQHGMTAYRYCIAFMTYFLAVEQYRKIPAYPELIKSRMDRLISKMIRRPVWEYWAETSRGVKMCEPGLNKPYPEEHDPVGNRNIMYSGHLGHMIALYEMLYRDLKWSEPGSIVFKWDEKEKYVYDNNSLQKVMFEQMSKNPWHAIECEPNLCFPECNQHPLLSFMLYDSVHGTKYADVREILLQFFNENTMIHPRTHETAGFYMIKQKRVMRIGPLGSSSANGWTGAFMHAWQPDLIERHYPHQRKDHVKFTRDGEAKLDRDFMEQELQYGFFAMLAAEVGDMDTRDKLLAHADRIYSPISENGTFNYPFDEKKKCTNLTDKLLALARALSKSALWQIHNRPFDEAHFKYPIIAGVDYPKALVSRAVWDVELSALIVTIEPGTDYIGKTSFRIMNLDRDKKYTIAINGKMTNTIENASTFDGSIVLDGRYDIVITEE